MKPDQSGHPGKLTDNDLDQLLAAANEELLAHVKAVADPTSTLVAIMARTAAATTAGSAISTTGSIGTHQTPAAPTANRLTAAVRPSKQEMYDGELTDLYRKYAVRVQGFLIRTGCDHDLAEEITDDAFLAARARWEDLRTLAGPETYVFKVARNESIKRRRLALRRAEAPYGTELENLDGLVEPRQRGAAAAAPAPSRPVDETVGIALQARAWLERFAAQQGHLRAAVPARSNEPDRYRALIYDAAEQVLRDGINGEPSDADSNAAFRAAYPEYFSQPGASPDLCHQRFRRAREDVKALLQGVVRRDELQP